MDFIRNKVRRFVGDIAVDVGLGFLGTCAFPLWVTGVNLLLIGCMSPYWYVNWNNHSGLWIKYQDNAWGLVLWSFYSTDLMRWVQFYEFWGSVMAAFSVITSTLSAFANETANKNFYKVIACVCSMFDGPFILAGCIVFYLQLEDSNQAGPSFWLTCIAGILHIPRGMVGLNELSAMRGLNRRRPHEN